MSVYTTVTSQELEALLREYRLGTLVAYQGINEGIENTNYFVTTTQGQYVLTLFESIGYDDLPYYLELMAFLAEHGVPSPHPLPDRSGGYLRSFKNRPAALVQRLQGHSVAAPNNRQCHAIGQALGHLHVEGRSFGGRRDHSRGPQWRQAMAEKLLPHMPTEDAVLLREELDFHAHHYERVGLPAGVIHADLFRDNALFCGDELTGIIDFYYACNGVFLYDIAVIVNDWCTGPEGALDTDKVLEILSAYHGQRALEPVERAIWPVMLRVAALRFWLSRLHDRLFPRPGELTQIKDPDQFKNILRQHVDHYAALQQLWV